MPRRRFIVVVCLVAALGVLIGVVGFGIASGTDPATAQVQYSAKFVCGVMTPQPEHESMVKPGNYATVINIHNPTAGWVKAHKRVALGYPQATKPPPIIAPKTFSIAKRRVLAIDCNDIWAMAGVAPGVFIDGHVHLGMPIELPVVAVYTSQTTVFDAVAEPGALFPDPGAGISIDVEYLQPLDLTH